MKLLGSTLSRILAVVALLVGASIVIGIYKKWGEKLLLPLPGKLQQQQQPEPPPPAPQAAAEVGDLGIDAAPSQVRELETYEDGEDGEVAAEVAVPEGAEGAEGDIEREPQESFA